MSNPSPLPSPDAPPAPMTDAEVASLAAEVGNLCVDIGRQWEELDSARADLSAEDRGNEREENARIERSHSVMLRKVFDRYRGAAPALPVGRAALSDYDLDLIYREYAITPAGIRHITHRSEDGHAAHRAGLRAVADAILASLTGGEPPK